MQKRVPWQHRLSLVDVVAKTAECAECGPVSVYVKKTGGVTCKVGARQQSYRLKLRKVYGLTEDQYDQMVEGQEGRCAICTVEMGPAFVDHDHVTGAVRGLLCQGCNLGLGAFRDNPLALQAAIIYLDAH